ncbi:hypothetical protein SAMN05216383_12044 [Prevotella sp. KH2C16]|nr:hypothetical protein SAMN05216383_12044 [Prevotella sp. KH2C16]
MIFFNTSPIRIFHKNFYIPILFVCFLKVFLQFKYCHTYFLLISLFTQTTSSS